MQFTISFKRPHILLYAMVVMVAFVLIVKFPLIGRDVLRNQSFRDVLYLYLASDLQVSQREDLLYAIWQRSCTLYQWDECDLSAAFTPPQMIEVIDDNLLHPITPLVLVDDSPDQQLPWALLQIGGVSVANQDSSVQQSIATDGLTLWGSGYIEARLFLFSSKRSRVLIDAVHDAPPPVLLDVTLGNHSVATLTYNKGDQSWESKSTPVTRIPGGYSILRVWYLNDYFDANLGLDRNAQMRSILISSD